MWNIHSTTQLLKEMSQSTELGEPVQLFFDHPRRSADVQRVLVLSNAGLSPPQYRLIHNVNHNDGSSGSVAAIDELRQGGLLAKLLYLGEFQDITQFAPDASDAGHNPPRLLRVQQRTVVPLDGASTTPLAVLDEPCTHREETVALESDDLILFYTDGITEARSPEGEFFGVARLDEALRALPEPVTPASAVEAVARAVGEFPGAGPLSDDQTLLALARRTEPGIPARAAGNRHALHPVQRQG